MGDVPTIKNKMKAKHKEELIRSIVDLTCSMEASILDDEVSEAFTDHSAITFQMKDWLNEGQFNEAVRVYDEETLNTIQNIVDGFINSIS